MLQDFLAGRTGPSPETNARPALSRGGSEFQPLSPSRVGQLSASTEEPAAAPAPARLETAQVEVIEEEGKVRRIVVTCRCCEKIEIDCEY